MEQFQVRTDLALEARERFEEDVEIRGVSVEERYDEKHDIRITKVCIESENGAKAMGKPVGVYITLEAPKLSDPDKDYHREVSETLAIYLQELLGTDQERSVLIVGLGNREVTPDALGPEVVGNLRITRHVVKEYGKAAFEKERVHMVSGIVPGVMAQTGMETAEILRGIIEETKPDLVIAIDALAARSVRRLGTTIQLTDTGIHPGSGVGNHRHSLTKESLGVPVMAIGVPTVVGAAAIVHDTVSALIRTLTRSESTKQTGKWMEEMDPEEQYELIRELLEPEFGPMYVTPPDIDRRIKELGFVISEGIHRALL